MAPENTLTIRAVDSATPSTSPTASAEAPRLETMNTGSRLWIISEETSMNRLTKPRIQMPRGRRAGPARLSHHQHCPARVLDDLLRHRPEQQAGELRAAAVADHDQIDLVQVRLMHDLLGGMTHRHLVMRLHAFFRGLGAQFREQGAVVMA